MSSDDTFLLVLAALLFLLGLYGFFSQSFFNWGHKVASKAKGVRADSEYFSARYLASGRVLGGALVIACGILYIFLRKFTAIRDPILLSLPFLALGAFFGVVAMLFLFSNSFNKMFWQHVWRKYQVSRERKWAAAVCALLSFGLCFGFYVFSEL